MIKITFLITFCCIIASSSPASATPASTISAAYTPRKVASLTVKYPAFTKFIPNRNDSTKYHLVVSAFDPIPYSSDYVYYFKNYDLQNLDVQRLDDKNLVWPNEVLYVNQSIYNGKLDPYGGIVVAGGFLVPTKSSGGIYYYPYSSYDRSTVTTASPIVLSANSQDKTTYFYHRTRYVDLNGDGLMDFLTCRTHKPALGSTIVELVGFLFDPKALTYNLKVISNDACDIFFEVADVDNDGRLEIIAAGFFISKLNLIYSDDPNNSFVNGNIKVKTIDANAGKLFDIGIYNLDQTGNLELLVTNHQGEKDAVKGAIFYYQLTGNVRTGNWKRNTIYNNFTVLKTGPNQAAPGGAKAFFPTSKDPLPYILLAGDGSEYAYLFQPTLTNNTLTYSIIWTEFYKGDTVGGVSIADINNDGYSEYIVPLYEANTIAVYTLAP